MASSNRIASERLPLLVLAAVLALLFGVQLLWIGDPGAPLVFDEPYYVNSARSMLNRPLPTDTPHVVVPDRPGRDTNPAHPPLAKLTIALGIAVFGDNPVGWRLPCILFGLATLAALYWLIRTAGGGRWLAVGSVALLAVDNLFFVHSRTATIDIFALPFMLLGVALYLRKRPLIAGVTIAVGGCMKLVALYALGVIVTYELIRAYTQRSEFSREHIFLAGHRLASCIAISVTAFLLTLGALDRQVTRFRNPIQHLEFMSQVHRDYTSKPITENETKNIVRSATPSSPWQWLLNRRPLLYFQDPAGPSPDAGSNIKLLGSMNTAICIFGVLGLLWAAFQLKADSPVIVSLVIAWSIGTFFPFVLIPKRMSYLYYMLIVLPGLCMAMGLFLRSEENSRVVRFASLLLVGFFFYRTFPFRSWPGL